jgi:hypothetical protein
MILDEDVRFFESALASLPDPYAPIMQDMLLHQMTWDSLEVKYNVCWMTLTRYRKKALADLSFLYDRHEQDRAGMQDKEESVSCTSLFLIEKKAYQRRKR